MNFKYLIFWSLLVFINPVYAQQKSISLSSPKSIASLKKNYAYALIDADNDNVAWIEYYTSTLFVYDIRQDQTKKIQLKKGHGPGEYTAITDLFIKGQSVYLADPKNNKVIIVNIRTGQKRDIPFRKHKVFRMARAKNGFFLLENSLPNVLISYHSLKNGRTYALNNDDFDVRKEFSNPFFRDGYLLSDKERAFLVTKYLPNVYIYNNVTKGFDKKVKFDQSEVETVPAQKMSNGAKAIYPPTKVDVATEDATYLAQRPNSIFLLSRGATDNRDYELDKLYEYDFKRQKFVDTYDLGTMVDEITSNENYVFAYSKQKNKIFKYKILTTK